MDSQNGQKVPVLNILNDGLRRGVYTAAQAAWCRPGEMPSVVCVGNTLNGKVTPATCFDVASLSKIFTASACLRLVSRGEMALDAPISAYATIEMPKQRKQATLAQLLSHEAGFAAYLPLFEQIPLNKRGSEEARRELMRGALMSEPWGASGCGVVYSDLGYMTLMHLLEHVTQMPLESLIQREVTEPLKLKSAHFRRIGMHGLSSSDDIAPTEACPWRGRVLVGEVHDDNAWTMGGISGHAGIFARADDIATFGGCWLQNQKEGTWLPTALAEEAVRRRSFGRGLGFDLKSEKGSSAGAMMSMRAFGHLGFTGCSLWVDPDNEVSVALLTNRVHLGRENTLIREFRPAFHDTVISQIC